MANPDKKKKREDIQSLRITKRSGKYNTTTKGIVKAPKLEQKEFKREVKGKIKAVKRGLK